MEWTDYTSLPLRDLYAKLEENTINGSKIKHERTLLKSIIERKELDLFVDLTLNNEFMMPDLSSLPENEIEVITHFWKNPNMTMKELGEYFDLKPGIVTQIVEKVTKGRK
jgi:hypothetical protein